MTKPTLMFHNNTHFEELEQLQELEPNEGLSPKKIKQNKIRKNNKKIKRALNNHDWEKLEELEGYGINVK